MDPSKGLGTKWKIGGSTLEHKLGENGDLVLQKGEPPKASLHCLLLLRRWVSQIKEASGNKKMQKATIECKRNLL